MLYKGYVSCSGLISSVGETEMILLGFGEERLALKLEKLQSPSISQCNIYFLVFKLLSSPVCWWQLSFTSWQGHFWWGQGGWTHHRCHLGVSQALPSAWCICTAPHCSFHTAGGHHPLCQHDNWPEPYSPINTQALRGGSTSSGGNCLWGLMGTTLQPSKQGICVKKPWVLGPVHCLWTSAQTTTTAHGRTGCTICFLSPSLIFSCWIRDFYSASRSSLKIRKKYDFPPLFSPFPGSLVGRTFSRTGDIGPLLKEVGMKSRSPAAWIATLIAHK